MSRCAMPQDCAIVGRLAFYTTVLRKSRQLLRSQRPCWLLRMPAESMNSTKHTIRMCSAGGVSADLEQWHALQDAQAGEHGTQS